MDLIPFMAKMTVVQIRNVIRAEWRRLASFGIIGLASLCLTVGLYALVSRVLWKNGPRTIQYTLVVIFVTWLNYEANRIMTFRQQNRTVGTVGRFAAVAVIATGLSSGLFWLGHEAFHFFDFTVIIVNAFIVAIFTFSSHRLFTFHERPWRWFGKIAILNGP